MTYIYHISRTLLQEKISKYGHYMSGRMLDAGSGSYNRYSHFFHCNSIVRMDVKEDNNVDIVGSADDMPFKDNEFDSVLSTQVFEHLEYPEKAAAEIARVIKRGGYLLVTVPQWNELHEEPHDYWRYTCFGLKLLFERYGFSTIEYEQYGGFFSTRAQMCMRYLIDSLGLYKKKSWFVRLISFLFRMWGEVAIWFDKLDNSKSNRKHTIGWIFVFMKNADHIKSVASQFKISS